MKEIGGYFELELNSGKEFHHDLIHLNTGRNCFEYILRAKEYKKIFLPSYICDAVLAPLKKLNIAYKFYSIDKNLDPLLGTHVGADEAIVYVNYFGIKQKTVRQLASKYKNLIVDNTQAFFTAPINKVDTFYSARKFFGVADGAYLFTTKLLQNGFGKDTSYNRMKHLLKRKDIGAMEGYKDFQNSENDIARQPIKEMSSLTKAILETINYQKSKMIREENFTILQNALSKKNILKINIEEVDGPMIYPFLVEAPGLKKKLINNNIYIPAYWQEVLSRVDSMSLEAFFSKNLIALPIDQRYSISDMNYILNFIQQYL